MANLNPDMFKEEFPFQQPQAPSQPAPSATPVMPSLDQAAPGMPFLNPDMFKAPEGREYVPVPKSGTDWSRYNQPFGEIKPQDPNWDEVLRSKVHDVLMGWGANPYMGRKMADVLTTAAEVNPIVGGAVSLADMPYDVTRGNPMHVAFDALGVIPGAMLARRGIQALRGTLPTYTMAQTPQSDIIKFVDPSTGATKARVNDELLNAARKNYGNVAQADLDYHPDVGAHFAQQAQYQLGNVPDQFGNVIPREAAPGVYGLLERRGQELSDRGTPITPYDLDILRRQLLAFKEGPERAGGARAASLLDQYMYNPPRGAITRMGGTGVMDFVRANLDAARGDWRAGKTALEVQKEINAATVKGTRRDAVGTGIQDRFGNLVNYHDTKVPGVSFDELEALGNVAKGDRLTNALTQIGQGIAGSSVVPQSPIKGAVGGASGLGGINYMLNSAGYGIDPITGMAIGGVVGAATPFVGSAFKNAATDRILDQANKVVKGIRENSPLFQARLRQDPRFTNPYSMNADAIAYALLPQAAKAAGGAYDVARVPYENRDDSESWSPQ